MGVNTAGPGSCSVAGSGSGSSVCVCVSVSTEPLGSAAVQLVYDTM